MTPTRLSRNNNNPNSLIQLLKLLFDDPPLEEHEVTMDQMDVEPVIPTPPSPIKPLETKIDNVVVTGFGYTAPGSPTALSKHNAKEDFSTVDKGKWKIDLESYSQFNTQ